MIEINLLPGAKRKRGAKGTSFQLPDFKNLAGLVKDPWLIAFVSSWVLVALGLGLLYLPRRAKVAELEPRLKAQQREAQRMTRVLALRRQLEMRRDTLAIEIRTIGDIDRERYVWAHILDAVAKALPQFTWLDDLSSRSGGEADSTGGGGVSFQMTGKSADIQAVTRFVRNLEASAFLKNVATSGTGTVNEQGRDVYTFTITAEYERPDSSQLTFQPLASTLVTGVRSGGGARRR